ncbi:MAG: hypothetical protein AB1896_09695 [Thermodesulfobacteriota bacterium]
MRGKGRLHVIFMWNRGRVRSARVSMGYLVLLAVFLLVYVPVSLWIFNDFYQMGRENEDLRARASALARQVKEKKPSPESLDDFRRLEAALESPPEGEEEAAPGPAVPGTTPPPAGPEDEGGLVSVSDLTFTPDPKSETMHLDFKLEKTVPDADAVAGFVVVVLSDNHADPPRRVAWPDKVTLSDGLPQDGRQGDSFSIRSFKTFTVTFNQVKEPENMTHAVILLYNEDGGLEDKITVPVKPQE